MLNSHLYAFGGEKNHCFDKFPATRATGNLYFVWHPSTRTETFDTDYVPAGCEKKPLCRRTCSGTSRLINSGEAPVNCN